MAIATTVQTHTQPGAEIRSKIFRLRDYMNTVIHGKRHVIDQVLVCLLSQGHLLLEDKPGLGKTTLAKALADASGGVFSRVQCTPDLLPSDITGFNVLNQKELTFEFRKGSVFADVLLTDEINRATPRTQSALLEAMAERQVTVDSERYPLSPQFFVIATQNPSEQHGTYPLPEAQLDRFAMKLSIGYPEPEDERNLLQSVINSSGRSNSLASPILAPNELACCQELIARIPVAATLQDYMIRVANKSRNHPHVMLGISPRGLLAWQRTAQASAFLRERDYVVPDDLQDLAVPVLGVRVATDHDQTTSILREILEQTPLPEYHP